MLRPYQIELIQSLRNGISDGHKRLVAVLPTGGGKTFTFCHIVKGALERKRRVLILTDRVELMLQAGGALNTFDLNPIELKAGSNPYLGHNLYVGMVETLHRRLKKKEYQYWLKNMDLIIIDECHMRSFDKLFEFIDPTSRVLGFTATPRRQGRKGQLGEYYTHLVNGVEIPFLVEKGFLAKPRYFGVEADLKGVRTVKGDYDQNEVADRFSKQKLYKGVISNLKEIAPKEKTLVFSSNIASSKELVSELQANGFNAKHLDSTMNATERRNVLKWLKNEPDAVLSNVGILTKGFDEPTIRNIVLYRATRSLPLYLQMVGRGSRIESGKSSFNILDFGNNIVQHGFWDEIRPWDLEVKAGRETLGAAVLKTCKNDECGMFIPASTIKCPHCGHVDEKEQKEQEFAKLQLLDPKELRGIAKGKTLEERVDMAKKGLVKIYWVLHNVKDFSEAHRVIQLMGWHPGWMDHNASRFHWGKEYEEMKYNGGTEIRI